MLLPVARVHRLLLSEVLLEIIDDILAIANCDQRFGNPQILEVTLHYVLVQVDGISE